MASRDNVFSPAIKGTVQINASTTSTTIQVLPTTQINSLQGEFGGTLKVLNAGSVPAFLRMGTQLSGLTATVPAGFSAPGDYPVGAGLEVTLDLGPNSFVAALTATSIATLYATPGQGS